MRAMIFDGHSETLSDVRIPEVGAEQVLVEVAYCGICGSDLHAAKDQFHPGTVMGHEFSGVVARTGSAVRSFSEGDRVVINPNGGWCGHCQRCRAGAVNLCPRVWETAVGLSVDGGLASHTALDATMLRHVPDSLDLRTAALVEPFAVALRTVRRSGFRLGESAVVFGGGPIGVMVTALLRASGAQAITVVEPSPGRREVAVTMGATAAVDPTEVDPVAYFPPQDRPAYGFDCTGAQPVLTTALRTIAARGVLTVTGFSRRPPAFDAADLLFGERDIRGSFIYVEEFDMGIDLLAGGDVDLTPLISGVVDVSQAPRAFEAMRTSTDAFKYLISASGTR